jgi:hypothetical protein
MAIYMKLSNPSYFLSVILNPADSIKRRQKICHHHFIGVNGKFAQQKGLWSMLSTRLLSDFYLGF